MQATDLSRFPVWACIFETMLLFSCAPEEDWYVPEVGSRSKMRVDFKLTSEQGWRTLLKYMVLYMFDPKAGGSVGTQESGDCDWYRTRYKQGEADWWTVVSPDCFKP